MPRLPSSADVPTVRIASDPGLRVPTAAFESPLGVAAEVLAPAVETFAKVKLRQDNRRDTVSRAGGIVQFTKDSDNERNRVEKDLDFSEQDVLEGYGSFLSQRKREIIEEHRSSGASEDSIATLTIRLGDVEAASTGKAAGISTAIGIAKSDSVFNDRIVSMGEAAAQNPTPENINKIINEDVPTALDDLRGSYRPDQEESKTNEASEHVVLSAVDRLIIQGRAEEAESLLIDGDTNRFLSPEKQREVRRRIETVFSSRKEASRQASIALAVERAKFQARRENINLLLQGMPSLAGTDNIIDTPAITSPFGEGQESSADFQDATRLFTTSRRLFIGGESQLANGLLSQARFIMENSPEIQRQKELDKPISDSLASEFGVPVGTTLRSVISVIPRSPEELAGAKAVSAARGRQQIGGEEQIAFIDEASVMIDDLLDEIDVDPTIVGIGGSLRATGQAAIGIIGDLGGRKLVESARDIVFESTDMGLDDITDLFDDPTLSVLSILENSIGLILARLRTPSGRIPVDVIKRSIGDVKISGLTSSERVKNRLNFVLKQLNRRSQAISGRFGLPVKETEIGIPRFRVKGGKLVPIGAQ